MADVRANEILRRVKARITETGDNIPDALDWLTTQIDEIEHEEAFDRAKFVLNGVAKDLGASDYRLLPMRLSMQAVDAAIMGAGRG